MYIYPKSKKLAVVPKACLLIFLQGLEHKIRTDNNYGIQPFQESGFSIAGNLRYRTDLSQKQLNYYPSKKLLT
jgi:hypothetical protein